MSSTPNRRALTLAASLIVAACAAAGTAAAQANVPEQGSSPADGIHHETTTELANAFDAVSRNTAWQQTSKLKLNFPTYHTEGIAYSQDHIFLSAVQILEPTAK